MAEKSRDSKWIPKGNQRAKFSQVRVIKNTGCLTLEEI
jgi:hypothetical protein